MRKSICSREKWWRKSFLIQRQLQELWVSYGKCKAKIPHHLLTLKNHGCFQYRYFRICRACPKLPATTLIPIAPQICPQLTKIIHDTEVIHLFDCPFTNSSGTRVGVAWNQWMSTQVLLHQIDDVLPELFSTKGASSWFIIITCIILNDFAISLRRQMYCKSGHTLVVLGINNDASVMCHRLWW